MAEHRYVYIVQDPQRAGNALVLSSSTTSTSPGSPRSPGAASSPHSARTPAVASIKVIYTDTDGNEISIGGAMT